MATTKIIPVKTNIRRISDYVQNKEKTAENTLTTTYGCSENNVESKFLEVINDENSTQREVLTSQTATLKQDYAQYESVKQKVDTTRIDSKPIKEKVGLLKRGEVDTGYVKVAKEDFETLKAAYQYMPVAKQELKAAERKADGEYQERLKYMTKYQETAETLKTTKQELSVYLRSKTFKSYLSIFI